MNSEVLQMSERQYRSFVHDSLNEGRAQFSVIAESLSALKDSHAELHASVHELKQQVVENTAITKQTRDDTAGLVAVDKTVRAGADAIASGAKGLNGARKVLLPWLVFVGLCAALWQGFAHGNWHVLGELWDAMK